MSEQAKPISDNLGDIVGAGPIVPNSMEQAAGEPAFGPVKDSMNVESPKVASERTEVDVLKVGAPKVELPKAEAPKIELPKGDLPKVEIPKAEIPRPDVDKTEIPRIEPKIDTKADAAKADAKAAGRIMVLKPGQGGSAETQTSQSGLFGKRRAGALAAVIALAAIAGAIGGALATSGIRTANDTSKLVSSRALEDAISRIDAEIAALRTNLEQASKHSATQLSKAGDRLDKVEKAQAEPAAKLAKLSETVDKLRVGAVAPAAASTVAAAPVASKETTASVQTANAAPVPVPAPKPEVARLPTVEGWVLRDVSNGSAVIEGRQGMYEVYAGDPVPGLGRVDAIRKQDGRWVVVTTKGLIVAR